LWAGFGVCENRCAESSGVIRTLADNASVSLRKLLLESCNLYQVAMPAARDSTEQLWVFDHGP
jgi:hypothetical protein